MEIGKRLRQARLEQGLSQRQLCGDVITRNMLSLIENGAASPSMETLRYLAARLGKTVSYFLDEDAVHSPNQTVLEKARIAFDGAQYDELLRVLEQYQRPDPIFDREEALLRSLALLDLAQKAISRGKGPYALELLERAAEAGKQTPYYTAELERRRLLLRARLTPTELPADDTELLLRADAAIHAGKPEDAVRYLEAAQVRSGLYWNYLRGRSYLGLGDYAKAQACLETAWEYDPRTCAVLLEQCCREQEDFKGAYRYACFLREQEK